MRFTDIYQKLGRSYFSLAELKNLDSSKTTSVNISHWIKNGRIIRLKKNLYLLKDYQRSFSPFEIAGILLQPSYISMETAMHYFYELIPDIPMITTSITTKKTQTIHNDFGTFVYQHLPPKLFFEIEDKKTHQLASREKTLLDFLYLHSSRMKPDDECWKSERFQNLETINWNRLKKDSYLFSQKKLVRLVESLESYFKSKSYDDYR